MTIDGGLDRWHVDGPVIWHSETAGLDYWHTDGIWSDYKAAESGLTAKVPWHLFMAIGEAI